jgi:hypothetical protein
MKKLLILLLLPLLSFSQVIEKDFDMVYLYVKKEKITEVRKTLTKVTMFEKAISVRYLKGLFMFEIIAEIPNDKNVTILIVNSINEKGVKVVFDDHGVTFSFEYEDRMIMFYDSDNIEEFSRSHINKPKK